MGLASVVVLLAIATQQSIAAPPTETTSPPTTGMCPKVAPLGNAVTHCMKLNRAHKDENKDKDQASMNATSAALAMCPQLCIMKTMNMVGTDMMPIESNMRSMLMALSSGIKDPKMAEMLGKLLDSCLKHHQKVISSEMSTSDNMAQMTHKCKGATELMTCMNKGLPCPLFDEMTPADNGGAPVQPKSTCMT